jgi:hypothetical protein
MKTAIIGSRGINKIDFSVINNEITLIISGGAKGVDTLAKQFAISNSYPIVEILPDYNKNYFKIAPIIRNYQIVDKSDIIYAFWDGKSKGTLSVINYAKKINKKIIIINSEKTAKCQTLKI